MSQPVDIPIGRSWAEFCIGAVLSGWSWFFDGLSPAGIVAIMLTIVVGVLNVRRHIQSSADRREELTVLRSLWDKMRTRPGRLED